MLLFVVGAHFGIKVFQGEKMAMEKDRKETVNAFIEGLPACDWKVNTPDRVVSENKSLAIVIKAYNSSDEDCESVVSLQAPGFDLSPSYDEQKIVLPKKGKESKSWILIPRRTGTFEISVSDVINTNIFGITVTNIFGLDAVAAKFISIVGGLFGPMLTVPWWWDRLRQRKKPPEKITMNQENPPPSE